jgi:soluble lytic murein transglycosylase-like protein
MICRLIFVGLTAAGLAFGSRAAAQAFHIYDHDYRPVPALETEQVGGSVAVPQGPRPVSRVAAVSGYREAIYLPLIREAELRHRIPPRLLQALIWAESRFNPMAISRAGAAGLAQLMPATARELGVRNRHDPAQNIDGGARYLRQMLDRFRSVHLALAAYNAGPGAVSRTGGIPRNGETPAYVRSIIDRWAAYGPS